LATCTTTWAAKILQDSRIMLVFCTATNVPSTSKLFDAYCRHCRCSRRITDEMISEYGCLKEKAIGNEDGLPGTTDFGYQLLGGFSLAYKCWVS
jgi:hypothetical protein